MQIHKNLYETLIQIPHLPLLREFNLGAMLNELRHIDEYVDYHVTAKASQQKYREAWSGRSLMSDTGSSRDGIREDYVNNPVRSTELALLMPTMMDAAIALGGITRRVRIMRIKARKSLDWHRHDKVVHNYWVVHIPLITTPKVHFAICPYENFPKPLSMPMVPIDERLVFRSAYAVGKPTLFNAYHFHNVYNEGDVDRISLMLYCNDELPEFREVLMEAIEAYDGPLVPTPRRV